MGTLGHVSNLYATEPGVALAEALVGHLGTPARAFFCNSGAEANGWPFKITRLTGRTKIVAAQGSFHGRTMGALALTGQPAKQEPFRPLPGYVTRALWGCRRSGGGGHRRYRRGVPGTDHGEGGVVVPPDGYLAAARAITSRHGAPAGRRRGADRGQADRRLLRPFPTGSPRTSSPSPKGLGGAADRCLPGRRPGRRSDDAGAAWQHSAGIRSAPPPLAVLRVLDEEDLISRARELGKTLRHGIESMDHPIVDHVRGAACCAAWC